MTGQEAGVLEKKLKALYPNAVISAYITDRIHCSEKIIHNWSISIEFPFSTVQDVDNFLTLYPVKV